MERVALEPDIRTLGLVAMASYPEYELKIVVRAQETNELCSRCLPLTQLRIHLQLSATGCVGAPHASCEL